MTAVQFRNPEVRLSEALAATATAVQGHVVTLRELLGHVGEQGLLVFCAILAMPFLIPVSLPFMSTALGLPMLMIGIAVVLGRVPWLPNRLLEHALPAHAVQHVLGRGQRVAERFEHLVRPRMLAMTGSALVNSLHGVALVVAVILLMAPLPLVPFANTLPALAIIVLCLGLAERDGVLLIAGYAMTLVSGAYIGMLLWLLVQAGQDAEGVLSDVAARLGALFGT